MDIDTSIKCKCLIRGYCNIDKCTCECISYCQKYLPLYEHIISGNHCWFTITPPSKEYETDESKLNGWMDNFTELIKCSDDFIIAVEYTEKMMLHFHMMIRIKDSIKFKKAIVQKWYFKGNIDVKYMKQPTMGLHYLFKQCDTTALILGRSPIITIIDVIEHKHKCKSAKLQFKKCIPDSDSE